MTGCGKWNEHLSITAVFMQREISLQWDCFFLQMSLSWENSMDQRQEKDFVVSSLEDCSSRGEKRWTLKNKVHVRKI